MLVKERIMKDFFEVPFNIYPESSPYVSPFKADIYRFLSDKNPLFKHFGEFTFFTAYNSLGTPVGRITAHIHHKSNELHGWKRGFFGYFDCEDNLETAKALTSHAEKWLKDKGCNEIMGNFNLTAMQQSGVMVGGFENQPYMDLIYTPEHIYKLLEQLGYERTFPMNTWEVDVQGFEIPKPILEKTKELKSGSEFEWRRLDKKRFKQQMNDSCSLLNDAFERNPMFVPLTEEEFYFQAKDMTMIVDPDISSFVYDKNNKPQGVIICLPDINPVLKETKSRFSLTLPFKLLKYKKTCKRGILIFAAVNKNVHAKGLGLVMVCEILQSMKKKGYDSLGVTWISPENKAPMTLIQSLGGKIYHELYLFKKDI